VHPDAKATAAVRGNADLKAPLTFVRFEPFVIPKKSLTGDSTERVDTRVLQVIYRVEDNSLPLFVGQQMDVFIEGSNPTTAMTMK
jgi:HlyD family secretion protein